MSPAILAALLADRPSAYHARTLVPTTPLAEWLIRQRLERELNPVRPTVH